jgi:hypothetical protein
MLLNVRLTREDEQVVKGLRRAKVNVSELVRRALRQAAASAPVAGVKRSAVLKQIIDAFPGPDLPSARPALDDRRAVADFIAQRLAPKPKPKRR